MKKLVMRLDLEDDKAKQKAMKSVSTLPGFIMSNRATLFSPVLLPVGSIFERAVFSLIGIDAIAIDMKGKKMTVIGTVDPVRLVSKLRKYWHADIITVGPAKEPEKKEEAKPAEEGKKEEGKKEEGKEEGKKEEGKGEEKKKEEGGKKDDDAAAKKPQQIPEHLLELIRARQYNPYMGNYPPYMAMANPYMNQHPQMHHPQPSYYVQRVVEDENPNGCSIF